MSYQKWRITCSTNWCNYWKNRLFKNNNYAKFYLNQRVAKFININEKIVNKNIYYIFGIILIFKIKL